MPTLYLTCGLPGSGKTTLAKRVEHAAPALRFTADEWLHELYPDISTPEAEAGPFRSMVERIQWPLALSALLLGCSVVLDWGLWSREERDHYRMSARAVGAHVVLCLVEAPIDELCRRLAERNANRPAGVFEISEAKMRQEYSSLFQRPTAEELALFDPMVVDWKGSHLITGGTHGVPPKSPWIAFRDANRSLKS